MPRAVARWTKSTCRCEPLVAGAGPITDVSWPDMAYEVRAANGSAVAGEPIKTCHGTIAARTHGVILAAIRVAGPVAMARAAIENRRMTHGVVAVALVAGAAVEAGAGGAGGRS